MFSFPMFPKWSFANRRLLFALSFFSPSQAWYCELNVKILTYYGYTLIIKRRKSFSWEVLCAWTSYLILSVSCILRRGFSKRTFMSPSWWMCSGASGIGLKEQAVEFPVLVLLALPSAVVLLRTDNVCPVFWVNDFLQLGELVVHLFTTDHLKKSF